MAAERTRKATKGYRMEPYAAEPSKLQRVAKRLGIDHDELRLAMIAESGWPGKSGVLTFSLRPVDADYEEIRRRSLAAELTSLTVETVVVSEAVATQLHIEFDGAIIGAPSEGER